ncbi:TetR/AcrR family transcriptional regulator [Clostridium oceanicum]|uniref:TetR/AcrR family transcriptional regulator n=1 Tax=Clostridium oceanicum TaxID=1543 RepID=A0ABN1JJC9_9CLOT
MSNVRKPVQKRSIEKKEKILKAGFDLFCEKGYHKTNTIDIAKGAGVSIGALYSYFKDKKDIYVLSFEQYLNSFSKLLFEKLQGLKKPYTLSVFVENWISLYIDLYATSSKALVQLRTMMLEDREINHHFCNFENEYFLKIIEMLNEDNINSDNLFEKVYISCILVDALNREKSAFPHNSLKFDVLKSEITKTISNLLS